MIEQRVASPDGYTVHNTTVNNLSYNYNLDIDLLDLIIEQNNTIIKQNTELINHLKTIRRMKSHE